MRYFLGDENNSTYAVESNRENTLSYVKQLAKSCRLYILNITKCYHEQTIDDASCSTDDNYGKVITTKAFTCDASPIDPNAIACIQDNIACPEYSTDAWIALVATAGTLALLGAAYYFCKRRANKKRSHDLSLFQGGRGRHSTSIQERKDGFQQLTIADPTGDEDYDSYRDFPGQ